MENIFKDIKAKIKATVPEIVWIDIDEGQFEAFGEAAPVDYPCVLVGFPAANYANMGRGQQTADIAVTVSVAFRVFESMSEFVPSDFSATALEHFAILRKVMRAVHLLANPLGHYTPLVRQSFTKEKSVDPKRYTVTYRCGLKDENISPDRIVRSIEELSITKIQ